MSLFFSPFVAFFSGTFPCFPMSISSAHLPYFISRSLLLFHRSLSPVPPLALRPSAFLPVLLALLTGFSKWPSEAAGSLPGAFGDLPGRHMPLSTLSSSACPPLLLLLYFNLFLSPLYHSSILSFSLSQPSSLLISRPHSSASLRL